MAVDFGHIFSSGCQSSIYLGQWTTLSYKFIALIKFHHVTDNLSFSLYKVLLTLIN